MHLTVDLLKYVHKKTFKAKGFCTVSVEKSYKILPTVS